MRRVPSARRLLLAASAAILIVPATAATASAACDSARMEVTGDSIPEARQAVRCLLNDIRADHGLRKFRSQKKLQGAATRYSRDMVDREFFAHDSPSGSTLVTRATSAGYIRSGMSWTVGENIGWGSGSLGTPEAMVRAWMGSAGHRTNILSPSFRDIGIGIAAGSPRGGEGTTYTTDFGNRS